MTDNIIVDTGVWIDFYNGISNSMVEALKIIMINDVIVVPPTIVQEILQGIREDAQYNHIKDILSYFTVLQASSIEAAIGAADLYRMLRKKGLTIRKSNDCLIAWYAITFSTTLVHADNDFDIISAHSKLRTRKAKK